MDAQKVDMFIMTNGKYLPTEQIAVIRERLLNVPEDKWFLVTSLSFKDPILALLLQLFLYVGRFYIGDIVLGIIQILVVWGVIICTCGFGFPIVLWPLIDVYFVMVAAKQKNVNALYNAILMAEA